MIYSILFIVIALAAVGWSVYEMGKTSMEGEAIKRGFATYTVDENAHITFKWVEVMYIVDVDGKSTFK